jgi:hypothetical protein
VDKAQASGGEVRKPVAIASVFEVQMLGHTQVYRVPAPRNPA